jgi:cobaltochelatase CobN
MLAADQKEKDNYVRSNSYFIRKELIKLGYKEENAEAISTARVYSETKGAYSPSIQFAVPAGDTWSDEKEISDLYMKRLSYAYGENLDGNDAKDAFKFNLKNVDAGVFSRSSNVYGILEHPMVAAYFGGLKMAIRNTSGKNIEMYITNLRDHENAKVETLDHFYNRELRSRYFNPKWIKGMMEHGYDGARYMDAFTENMWVWDVTTPEMVTEENWNEVYNVYVKDKYNLDLEEYFTKNNPYALQSMISTMLEVTDKGYWKPSQEVFDNLVKVYAELVAKHGVSGDYGSTDKASHKDVTEALKNIQDVSPKLIEQFQQQVKKYDVNFEPVKGYEVKEVKNDALSQEKINTLIGVFILLAALLLIGLGWWSGKRKKSLD